MELSMVSPKLSIAAIFKHIENEIAYEIDEPESRSNWRELVVATRQQIDGEIEQITPRDQ